MGHGGREACSQLLVRGEVARSAEVEQRLRASVDLERDLQGTTSGLEQFVGEAGALGETLHRGAGSPARRHDAPLGVEDDHALPALLDEYARALFGAAPLYVLAAGRRAAPEETRHQFFTSYSPELTTVGSIVGVVPKVLIVEDDEVIARGMTEHLGAAGFDAVSIERGDIALARLRYEKPDVCVLDLMIPGLDGWKLIETAREEGIGTPIVVVSARGTEHDRVNALEIGADDYLVKPFSMKELVARVRAAARRSARVEEVPRGAPIEIEELRIDPDAVQAYVDGESAELTPTEFRLLYALALEPGRVVTRDELLQRLWGRRQSHRDRTVDVFVRRLRDKVDRRAPRHTFIQTRYGVGYKFEPEPKS